MTSVRSAAKASTAPPWRQPLTACRISLAMRTIALSFADAGVADTCGSPAVWSTAAACPSVGPSAPMLARPPCCVRS